MATMLLYGHNYTKAQEFTENFLSEEVLGEIKMNSSLLEDVLMIEVSADNMKKPVLGLAFHLNFDNQNLKFLRYEPGDFLEMGGDPIYLVDIKNNKIIFGESLRKDDKFPIGKGLVTKFYFQVLNKDRFTFEFSNNVVSTLEIIKQDLQNINWENYYLDENLMPISSFSENSETNNSQIEIQTEYSENFFEKHRILLITILIATLAGIVISYSYLGKNSEKRVTN